jgi:hypothetical protein
MLTPLHSEMKHVAHVASIGCTCLAAMMAIVRMCRCDDVSIPHAVTFTPVLSLASDANRVFARRFPKGELP